MRIETMNRKQALKYISWEYAPPYEFYNIPSIGFEETMHEILDESGMDYF